MFGVRLYHCLSKQHHTTFQSKHINPWSDAICTGPCHCKSWKKSVLGRTKISEKYVWRCIPVPCDDRTSNIRPEFEVSVYPQLSSTGFLSFNEDPGRKWIWQGCSYISRNSKVESLRAPATCCPVFARETLAFTTSRLLLSTSWPLPASTTWKPRTSGAICRSCGPFPIRTIYLCTWYVMIHACTSTSLFIIPLSTMSSLTSRLLK